VIPCTALEGIAACPTDSLIQPNAQNPTGAFNVGESNQLARILAAYLI
jgi:hypothetical protein